MRMVFEDFFVDPLAFSPNHVSLIGHVTLDESPSSKRMQGFKIDNIYADHYDVSFIDERTRNLTSKKWYKKFFSNVEQIGKDFKNQINRVSRKDNDYNKINMIAEQMETHSFS